MPTARAIAQQSGAAGTQAILDRLDALEKQNQQIVDEIRALREELKTQPAASQQQATPQEKEDAAERTQVSEERIKELAETKVGTSQRFPVQLTGMFLMDASRVTGESSSVFSSRFPEYGDTVGGGASLAQSILGLNFQGPQIFAGGRVSGFLNMDFYSTYADYGFRIRRGMLTLDWKHRSISVGQDKPLISPLQPTSFARVAVPPLAGAGNLWDWRPQLRYEERLTLSSRTKAAFQAALFQTDEDYTVSGGATANTYQRARPSLQARAELSHNWSDTAHAAVGMGVHESTSHIDGMSAPSRALAVDFSVKPFRLLEISGTVTHGKNFANLGGAPGGVTLVGNALVPIRGTAGWMQLSFPLTSRLTIDAYVGRQWNRAEDLSPFGIARTLAVAGNILYRLGPNLVVGFEGSHNEILYLNSLGPQTNRYDATLAYLF